MTFCFSRRNVLVNKLILFTKKIGTLSDFIAKKNNLLTCKLLVLTVLKMFFFWYRMGKHIGMPHTKMRQRNKLLHFTRWFKYDRDYLCVNKSQFVPVIFEPPCNIGFSHRACVYVCSVEDVVAVSDGEEGGDVYNFYLKIFLQRKMDMNKRECNTEACSRNQNVTLRLVHETRT
jgi:hypothetical protein